MEGRPVRTFLLRIVCVAVVLATSIVGPTRAADPAAPIPVTFTDCTLDDGVRLQSGSMRLGVKFRNVSGRTLSMVRVAYTFPAGVVTTAEDWETLGPGAVANRWLTLDTGAEPFPGRGTCVAAAVVFADGTTWTNAALGADADLHVIQTPGAPLRIAECISNEPLDLRPGTLKASFVNEAGQPATRVALSFIVAGRRVARFEERGTFSPHAAIVRWLRIDPNAVPLRALRPQCRVDAVTFADATTWTNPAEPLEPFGTRQTPGSNIDILACEAYAAYSHEHGTRTGVSVTFRNASPVEAKDVRFSGWLNGKRIAVGRYIGTMTTGHTLVNTMAFSWNDFPLGTTLPDCYVDQVVYANGTTWTRPDAVPVAKAAPH